MNKLILVGLLVISNSVFADFYSDLQRQNNEQLMLNEQRQQTWALQEQLEQQESINAGIQELNNNN